MIVARCPSLPFFHKIENAKVALLTAGVFLLFTKLSLHGLVLLGISALISAYQWWWFKRGWMLTRSLGLKEYMLLESNLKIEGLPPGKVFETHLQASLLDVVKKLVKKPDFKQRTAEMRRSYFDDYEKIAEACRSGRWGDRVYIVGITHPNVMKWWVEAFESAGFKAVHLGYNIDPGAKLGKLGWWMAQIASTGHARSKKPPENWKTCIAVWERGRSCGNLVL